MGKFIDITGKRFGTLVACKVSDVKRKDKIVMWECLCDCGNVAHVRGSCLRSGHTKSCGCRKYGNNVRHGGSANGQTRLYRIWAGMKNRCKNASHIGYKYYGGKGVSVCDEWEDFVVFKEWASQNGYEDHLTIDRIDTNEGYNPKNCRWATYKTQGNNSSKNHYIAALGESMTIKQWAEKSGISERTISARIMVLGWSPEDAVTVPVRVLKRGH